MNTLFAIIFLVLLICALVLGWTARKWIERFENMERTLQRRDLPNAVKAGLENEWALGDLARMINGKPNEQLMAMAAIVRSQMIASDATDAVLKALLNDISELRRDPRGYNPDEALQDK